MTTTNKTISSADINASIGRTAMAARMTDGSWVLCVRTSGFMAPLVASVIRPLTESEASDAEGALVSVDGPALAWLAV
jgi:hypothetical protein